MFILDVGFLMIKYMFPVVIYSNKRKLIMKDFDKIQNSGNVIVNTKCGMNINGFNFSKSVVKFSIYRDGVIIKPFIMYPCGIYKKDIRKIIVDSNITFNVSSDNMSSPFSLVAEDVSNAFMDCLVKWTQPTIEIEYI